MTNPNRGFNKAFTQELKKVNLAERAMASMVVQYTFENIHLNWPVQTGYSLANHRISITGRPINRVEPAQRPSERGALVGKAQSVREAQLAKLKKLPLETKNRRIIIGNAVDYGPDVGYNQGEGIRIYVEAAQIAVVRARQDFDGAQVNSKPKLKV